MAAALTLAMGTSSPPPSTASPCDQLILQTVSRDDPLRYQLQPTGDRCEGRYVRLDAGDLDIHPVSLLRGNITFGPDGPITVAWGSGLGQSALHIQAISLTQRVHYQMDALVPAASGTWIWPSDLVKNSLKLSPSEVGLLASLLSDRGRFIPLNVGPGNHSATSVHLLIVPGAQAKEIFVSILRLDASGQTKEVKRAKGPLLQGFYPGGEPVDVALPEINAAGQYAVLISADFKSSGHASVRFLVHVL